MIKAWDDMAWEDYLYWQKQDKKTLKRINRNSSAQDFALAAKSVK